MRRNGHTEEKESSPSRSGWLAGIFTAVGGVGIGAGLIYLLDPDKGRRRRNRIWSRAADLASSAKDYAGEAVGAIGSRVGSALGSARGYAGEQLQNLGDYAGDKTDDIKAFAQRQVFGETRAEHRVGVALCALSSMALGAALMYAFDPASGKNRRRMAREKASNLASSAGDYARQAGDAVKSGVNQVRDKIRGGASRMSDEMHGESQTSGSAQI